MYADNKINATKVEFNYDTHTWMAREYLLPCYDGDYGLLTPHDMLTRDETFINRSELTKNWRK